MLEAWCVWRGVQLDAIAALGSEGIMVAGRSSADKALTSTARAEPRSRPASPPGVFPDVSDLEGELLDPTKPRRLLIVQAARR